MTDAAGSLRASEIREVATVPFLRDLAGRVGALHLPAFAAGLAYGAVFATVPTLALLVLLLGVFNATDLVSRAMDELGAVLPTDAARLIEDQLTQVATTDDQSAFGVGVVISALVALWGASGAMRRVMEALNIVHGTEESRPFVRKLFVSIALAVGTIVVLSVTLAVVALGGDVATRVFGIVGLGKGAETVWSVLRWPLLAVLAWLGIASLYRFAPADRQVGGIATPGTLIATGGWIAFSVAFSVYVGSIGSMEAWGSAAGIVVFLLYLQYVGLIILAGALVDVVLWDRSRPRSRVRRWIGGTPTR